MLELISTLGFSKIDAILLLLCPILGCVGSMVNVLMVDVDFSKAPKYKDYANLSATDEKIEKEVIQVRGAWYMSRLFIGGVSGLVLALYFAGSIKPEATAMGRLLALSVVAGYVAPAFWKSQRIAIVEKQICD